MNNFDAVDFRYLLLDHYKKLAIPESELAVILMVDHLTKQGNSFVTADMLSLKMNFKTAEIDGILATLLQKGYLVYVDSPSGMAASLQPLKDKLAQLFQIELTKNHQNLHSAERSESLSRLYAYYEKRLNRTLSPLEQETINTWLDDAYSEDDIRFALEDGLASGKKTIKAIDKILRKNRKKDDFAREGYSGVSDTWNSDIEKTIEIAKTKWLKDDDE